MQYISPKIIIRSKIITITYFPLSIPVERERPQLHLFSPKNFAPPELQSVQCSGDLATSKRPLLTAYSSRKIRRSNKSCWRRNYYRNVKHKTKNSFNCKCNLSGYEGRALHASVLFLLVLPNGLRSSAMTLTTNSNSLFYTERCVSQ